MTVLHDSAARLPTPFFVAWTRAQGCRLPFPLNTREQEYVDRPSEDELTRLVRREGLEDSEALAALRLAFAAPALTVFAVRSAGAQPDAPETKYAAFAGREPHSSALVVLDADEVIVRAVADTALAASVASAVGGSGIPQSSVAAFESTTDVLGAAEDVCLSDESWRTKRTALNAAGLPPSFVTLREQMIDQPRTALGLISAVSHSQIPGESGLRSVSARRSGVWVETADAAYLSIALPRRGSVDPVLVTPVTADHLFRAATQAIGSCYEGVG